MRAEDIFLACKEMGTPVSLATVYRSLNALAAEGRIVRLSVPGQPDRYDGMTVPHQHLVCDVCGELADINILGLESMLQEAAGLDLTGYDLCLHYICPLCRKDNDDERLKRNQN